MIIAIYFWDMTLAATLVLGLCGSIVWNTYSMPAWPKSALVWLGAFLLSVIGCAFLRTFPPREVAPRGLLFLRTVLRSMAPLLLVCLLAVGVIGGALLHGAEAHAVAPLSQPGMQWFNELDNSDAVKLRDYYRALNREWLAAHGGSAPAEPR